MLNNIAKFKHQFEQFNMQVTAPDVVQTLSEDELIDLVPKHHGWIIGDDPATKEVFQAGVLGNLRAAVKWGIGTDNVDFNACRKLGIPIKNTPGLFGTEVADLAICYLLGLARDAFQIDREVRKGDWLKPAGVSLPGKVLGIVGLGDIGTNIAHRAHAHGLRIIAWDPCASDVPDYIQLQKKWPEMLSICDFLVFACALNETNYHIFNKTILEHLKMGVRVINISRGALVNEEALLEGLKSGLIHGAALDVYEIEPVLKSNELLNHPKCIFGSHNGSNTIEAVERASTIAISLLHNFLNESAI